MLGLIHQVQDLPKDLANHGGVSTLLVAAMDVALLINQAGQFHQHLERRKTMPRRPRRWRRRTPRTEPAAPPPRAGEEL